MDERSTTYSQRHLYACRGIFLSFIILLLDNLEFWLAGDDRYRLIREISTVHGAPPGQV
jgi:hypothetical protein